MKRLLIACACLAVSAQVLAERVLPPVSLSLPYKPLGAGMPQPAPAGHVFLGQGYNALTNDYLVGQCVQSTGPSTTFGSNQLAGTINYTFINTVSGMAENEAATGSDAGFNFTYKLITVGFGTGSNSDSYFNSVDQYARIYRRIATRGEMLAGDRWTKLGRTEIKNPLKRFTQICGTHYVHAVYYGHLLDDTYRFALNKQKYDASSRNDFSLGVKKIFGFDYSDTSNQQKVSESSSLTIEDRSRGVLPVPPPDSGASAAGVSALVKYAREDYVNAVKQARPEDGLPVLVELVPYSELPDDGSGRIPSWPDDVMGAVSGRAALYQNFLTAFSDLNFALSLTDDQIAKVYKETRADVEARLQTATDIQKNFRGAARNCMTVLEKGVDDAKARTECTDGLDNALDEKKIQSIRLTVLAQ